MRRRARPVRSIPPASYAAVKADMDRRSWLQGQAQTHGLSEAVVTEVADAVAGHPLDRPRLVQVALMAEAQRCRTVAAQVREALGDHLPVGHGMPDRIVERARSAGADRLLDRSLAMVPAAIADLEREAEQARVQAIAAEDARLQRHADHDAWLAREAAREAALRDPTTTSGRIRLALEAAGWYWHPGCPGYEVPSPDGYGLRTVGRQEPGWYIHSSPCQDEHNLWPVATEAARRLDEEAIADLLRVQARTRREYDLARQAEAHRRAEELARAEARETAAMAQRREDQATDGLSDEAEVIARRIVEAGAWDDNDGRDGSASLAVDLARHAARPDALAILRAVARRYGITESRLTDLVMARIR